MGGSALSVCGLKKLVGRNVKSFGYGKHVGERGGVARVFDAINRLAIDAGRLGQLMLSEPACLAKFPNLGTELGESVVGSVFIGRFRRCGIRHAVKPFLTGG